MLIPLPITSTPRGECIAFSTDDRQYPRSSSGNPVVKQITGGNRDPKAHVARTDEEVGHDALCRVRTASIPLSS